MKRAELFDRVKSLIDGYATNVNRELRTLTDDIVELVPQLAREQIEAAIAGLGKGKTDVAKPNRRKNRTKARGVVPRRAASPNAGRRSRLVDRARAAKGEGGVTPSAAAIEAAVGKKPRAKMKCGLCGEIGFRREGCGRTHNLTGSPLKRGHHASGPAPVDPEPPPPITPRDRFARIEAAAATRRGPGK